MTIAAVAPQGRPKHPRARLTPNDRTVLACLREHQEPMKAYEILECLREEGINAPMTVYRALGRLASRGLVRKMESINAYFAIPQDESPTLTAFLVCQTCGAVGFKPLELPKIAAATPELEVIDASIELKTGCFSAHAPALSGQCTSDGK